MGPKLLTTETLPLFLDQVLGTWDHGTFCSTGPNTGSEACWDPFPSHLPWSRLWLLVYTPLGLWGQLIMKVCLELGGAGVFTPCLLGPLWKGESWERKSRDTGLGTWEGWMCPRASYWILAWNSEGAEKSKFDLDLSDNYEGIFTNIGSYNTFYSTVCPLHSHLLNT